MKNLKNNLNQKITNEHGFLVYETIQKIKNIFNLYDKNKICLAFSGGKDSTVLLDLIKKAGFIDKIKIVFCNTLMEYQKTLEFVYYLKNFYNIEIITPKKPLPIIFLEDGLPVVSKYTSEMINRLQKHNFDFKTNLIYEEALNKYKNLKGALKWFYGKNIILNCPKWLKQKLININFNVSNKCCYYLKKLPFKEYNKKNNIELSVLGIRSDEGGIRKISYKGCYLTKSKPHKFLPLKNWKNKDIDNYIKNNNLKISECYTKYKLNRTGCVGCPFSQNLKHELEILKKYEHNKYIAINNMLKKSYEIRKK